MARPCECICHTRADVEHRLGDPPQCYCVARSKRLLREAGAEEDLAPGGLIFNTFEALIVYLNSLETVADKAPDGCGDCTPTRSCENPRVGCYVHIPGYTDVCPEHAEADCICSGPPDYVIALA